MFTWNDLWLQDCGGARQTVSRRNMSVGGSGLGRMLHVERSRGGLPCATKFQKQFQRCG